MSSFASSTSFPSLALSRFVHHYGARNHPPTSVRRRHKRQAFAAGIKKSLRTFGGRPAFPAN